MAKEGKTLPREEDSVKIDASWRTGNHEICLDAFLAYSRSLGRMGPEATAGR